jgi:FkbM family methyltransferase
MRTLKPGQHAIDVGANIGMYTVLMAAWVGPGGRVLAYEPNPDVLSFLRDNIALNWVNDRVSVREAGASDASGRITLYVTERFKGNSSLEKPGEDYYANLPTDTVREIEVTVEPLDSGAESLGHVDIVKIDVEGAEHRVMGGMTRLLSQRLVDRVSFEVYRERMGEPWAEFSELLRGHASRGWRFHDIADDGALRATDLEEILRVGRYSQVVMTGPQLPG